MRHLRRLTVIVSVLSVVVAGLAVAEAIHVVAIWRYASLSPTCRVSTNRPVIALTFDDGPDPALTPDVVTLLTHYQDRATFFLIGANAETFPELVREEADAGMEIGNHTWSHPNLPTLSTAQAATEIKRTQDELLGSTGVAPQLFRAPFGLITPDELRSVEATGLTPVHWSIPLDHYVDELALDPTQAAAKLLDDIRPGDIILAHDAHDGGIDRNAAMATLRILLPALDRRGIEVTTVSELLNEGIPVPATPRLWFWQGGFSCPR
jgi:peptidoglycan-N-acetylglucosamine deacetylase